ncbi:ABC transporter permease [Thermococci archaeon]|nr:MAG: ABC transporter permease [Thermococci archaeon]
MKFRAVKGIFIKEVKEFSREKMAIFWVFIFPILWLLILGGIWGNENPTLNVKVGYYSRENVSWIIHAIESVEVNGERMFTIYHYSSWEDGINALKKGKIDAFLVFPNGFTVNLTKGYPTYVEVYYDKSDPQTYQIVKGAITGFFTELSSRLQEERLNMVGKYVPRNALPYILGFAKPVTLEEKTVEGTKVTPMEFYVTSFIGIQFLFATMLMMSSSVLEEIEKGTLRRIASSPASPWDFLIGKMSATFAIILVSIFTGLAFAFLAFHVKFFPSPLGWVVIVLASIFSMSLGLAIGMLTGSIKTTNAVVNLISMPLLFFAAVVVPESLLPSWARPIAKYFPLGAALKALRKLEIYHLSVSEVRVELLIVTLGALMMLAVALFSYRWRIRRLSA